MTCYRILLDDLAELRQRRSMKWDNRPDDVRPLWVAEMDCALAEPVRRTLAAAVARSDTGYAHRTGRTSAAYAESFAGFADRHWGWSVDPTHAALMPDVMQGATHALRALTAPDSPVVLTPPVYPPFFGLVAHSGRQLWTARSAPTTGWTPRPWTDLARATAGGRRAALLLASPHNPTGTVPAPRAGRGRGPRGAARGPGGRRRDPRPVDLLTAARRSPPTSACLSRPGSCVLRARRLEPGGPQGRARRRRAGRDRRARPGAGPGVDRRRVVRRTGRGGRLPARRRVAGPVAGRLRPAIARADLFDRSKVSNQPPTAQTTIRNSHIVIRGAAGHAPTLSRLKP